MKKRKLSERKFPIHLYNNLKLQKNDNDNPNLNDNHIKLHATPHHTVGTYRGALLSTVRPYSLRNILIVI